MLGPLAKIRRNNYFKSAVAIVILIVVVLGIFAGLEIFLNNSVPVRVVESGSMSLSLNFITGPPYSLNDFLLTLEHPFDRTLDTGDIIIIQNVNPKDLNTNYPNSDIIIYQNPDDLKHTPIVHRIVAVNNINGTLYFQTKGDGNGDKWPAVPTSSQYDSNLFYHNGIGVPQDLVEGKVVMRIPYFGWITLFLRDNPLGLPVIIGLIMLLVILEFVIPIIWKESKKEQEKNKRGSPNFSMKAANETMILMCGYCCCALAASSLVHPRISFQSRKS
jgi:signal peptidase I